MGSDFTQVPNIQLLINIVITHWHIYRMNMMDHPEMSRQHQGRYEKTTDMIEDRQYWKMMVKTGPQRCGDGP